MCRSSFYYLLNCIARFSGFYVQSLHYSCHCMARIMATYCSKHSQPSQYYNHMAFTSHLIDVFLTETEFSENNNDLTLSTGFWLDCENRAVILLVLSISGCHSLCPPHWTSTIWRIAQSWKTINERLSSWDDKHLVLEVIMRWSGAFMHLAEFHPKSMWMHRRQILILHKGRLNCVYAESNTQH